MTPPDPKTPAGEALSDARAREVLAQERNRWASPVGLRLRRANLNDVAVPIDIAIAAMLAFAKEATPPASDAAASDDIRAVTAEMRRFMPNACGDWADKIDAILRNHGANQ